MSRRVPTVRQLHATDCGAACLGMVLGYFGKRVPLDELRDATGTDRDGVDALALVHAARTYGLSARGVAADLDALEHLPRASVLHWKFGHFVVFERATGGGVHVVDPAVGRRRVPMDTFRRSYTGVAIVFEPAQDFTPSGTRSTGSWRYLRPVLGRRAALARVLTTSVLVRLFALALPLLTGLFVDEVAPRDDRRFLIVLAAVAAAIVTSYLLSSLVRAHLLLQLRTRLDATLTLGFIDHLVDLPYAFFLHRPSGDLMMRLQSNATVREILTTGALSSLLDGTLASLYLVLLFAVSVPLALVVLVVGTLQVFVLAVTWRRNSRLMAEGLQAESASQSYAYELLAGIETLKAAGAEHRAAERWGGFYVEQINVALARGRVTSTVEAVMSSLRVGSPLAVLVVGGLQVVDGSLSLGTMLAAAALGAGFLEPLAGLVGTGLQLQLLGSYMERINDVLDTPREQEGETVRAAPQLRGGVTAERISFAYGSAGPLVVRDVSLEIRPGQHVAIVGRSGSGKSTLAHVLLGLYEPREGRVLFDGIELGELEVRSLRRQFGIVTQRPYLFGVSLRENIALTDPSLPLDAVVHSARMACIHDDIEAMPMKYETPLLDGGSSLSGGQHQRIALARALVHRPAILLLDEATSELDTITEQRVYENLAGLHCTTIVIAHRLSTITAADLIVVMDDGRVVEQGTHDELVARRGTYANLIAAQTGRISSSPNQQRLAGASESAADMASDGEESTPSPLPHRRDVVAP